MDGRFAPELRDDPRMAGCVLRYHTWPHVRPQSNAEHSWQVVRLLLAIWSECPREVIVYAQNHDVGEIGTGDIPFPIKRDNPVVKREMDRIEERTQLSMCIPWGLQRPTLTLFEKYVVKIADMLEMWEWSIQEQSLGNQFANIVRERTGGWLLTELMQQTDWQSDQARTWWPAIRTDIRQYMARRIKTWPVPGWKAEEFD